MNTFFDEYAEHVTDMYDGVDDVSHEEFTDVYVECVGRKYHGSYRFDDDDDDKETPDWVILVSVLVIWFGILHVIISSLPKKGS